MLETNLLLIFIIFTSLFHYGICSSHYTTEEISEKIFTDHLIEQLKKINLPIKSSNHLDSDINKNFRTLFGSQQQEKTTQKYHTRTLNTSEDLTNQTSRSYITTTPMFVTISVLYGLISIVSVVGNFLIILVVMKNRRMQNVTNYFICNLAMADIVIGIFVLPFQVLYLKIIFDVLQFQ